MKSEYNEALAAALRYVSHKDRTVYEVCNKLKSMEYSEDVIDNVITCLKEHGYLNDRRYAEYYLVCYQDKRSLKRIEMELTNRGIDDSLIRDILSFSEIDELQAVRKAIKKQLVRRGIEDVTEMSFEDRNKISKALFRQGFKAEHIREVMREYEM